MLVFALRNRSHRRQNINWMHNDFCLVILTLTFFSLFFSFLMFSFSYFIHAVPINADVCVPCTNVYRYTSYNPYYCCYPPKIILLLFIAQMNVWKVRSIDLTCISIRLNTIHWHLHCIGCRLRLYTYINVKTVLYDSQIIWFDSKQ